MYNRPVPSAAPAAVPRDPFPRRGAPVVPAPKPRVFVSATTRDLGSYRRAVADWLAAHGHEPVIQDAFDVQPDTVTVGRMLRDRFRDCDAVVCLLGDHFGAEPSY